MTWCNRPVWTETIHKHCLRLVCLMFNKTKPKGYDYRWRVFYYLPQWISVFLDCKQLWQCCVEQLLYWSLSFLPSQIWNSPSGCHHMHMNLFKYKQGQITTLFTIMLILVNDKLLSNTDKISNTKRDMSVYCLISIISVIYKTTV